MAYAVPMMTTETSAKPALSDAQRQALRLMSDRGIAAVYVLRSWQFLEDVRESETVADAVCEALVLRNAPTAREVGR